MLLKSPIAVKHNKLRQMTKCAVRFEQPVMAQPGLLKPHLLRHSTLNGNWKSIRRYSHSCNYSNNMEGHYTDKVQWYSATQQRSNSQCKHSLTYNQNTASIKQEWMRPCFGGSKSRRILMWICVNVYSHIYWWICHLFAPRVVVVLQRHSTIIWLKHQ